MRVGKSELATEVTGKNNMGVVRSPGACLHARTFTFQKQGAQRAHLPKGTVKKKQEASIVRWGLKG